MKRLLCCSLLLFGCNAAPTPTPPQPEVVLRPKSIETAVFDDSAQVYASARLIGHFYPDESYQSTEQFMQWLQWSEAIDPQVRNAARNYTSGRMMDTVLAVNVPAGIQMLEIRYDNCAMNGSSSIMVILRKAYPSDTAKTEVQ